MRLTSAPSADVTVNIYTDGATKVKLGGRVVLDALMSLSTTVDFADNGASLDTITRQDGMNWADEGFRAGMLIQVQGSGSNDLSGNAYLKINDVDGNV